MGQPKLIHTVKEMREYRGFIKGRVGLVPTMGALHEGHRALVRRLKKSCDYSIVSIFVNPLQFGPNEDYEKYPRPQSNDIELIVNEKIDAVFTPTVEEMFPKGFSTYVEEGQLSTSLCGKYRPGHFKGVATVVLKLFHIVQPSHAIFGLKDAQQFLMVQRMVRDLNMNVEVEAIETIREPDGLALSSRNQYLSAQERKKAPLIYRNLVEAEKNIMGGMPVLKELGLRRKILTEQGFAVQYLECLKLPDLTTVGEKETISPDGMSFVLAVAAYLGKTRLIDNIFIGNL